jgi:putative ABC transport system permease protein
VNALTSAGLVRRGIRARRVPLLLLALVVFAASLVLTGWPRLTTETATQDLRYSLDRAGAAVRDVQASVPVDGSTFDFERGFAAQFDRSWAVMPAALARVRGDMPPALAAVTRAGRFVAQAVGPKSAGMLTQGTAGTTTTFASYSVIVEANPALSSDARLVAGTMPARAPSLDAPLPVLTTAATAKTYHWSVGETLGLPLADGSTRQLVLSGTIAPRNAHADYWQLDTSRARPGVNYSPDGGHAYYTGVVWMNPDDWTTTGPELTGQELSAWYPVASSAFTVDGMDGVDAATQHFLGSSHELGGGTGQPFDLSTRLSSVLADFTQRAAPANALLTVFATGPIGVAVALIALQLMLLASRRRGVVALQRARGVSAVRLASAAASETVVVSAPAAILGGVAGILAASSTRTVDAVIGILACALLPPLAAAALDLPWSALAQRSRARRRIVVELVIVALAALSVVVLLRQGREGVATTFAPDPVFVLAPLLITAGVTVLLLRVYPLALRAVGAALRRGRGAVAFVGWASFARTSQARVWPMFAVVAAVSIAVFSLGVLTTERAGVQDSAIAQARSDLTVQTTGPLDAARIRRIAALPGVGALATVQVGGVARLDGSGDSFDLYFADPAQVRRVHDDLPASLRPFAELGALRSGEATAIVGGIGQNDVPASGTLSAFVNRDAAPLRVRLDKVDLPFGSFLPASPWIVLDRTRVPKNVRDGTSTRALLISIAPGHSAAAVENAVRAQTSGLGPVTLSSAESFASATRSQPLVSGMESLTLAAALASALFCVAAFLLALGTNAPVRRRLLARLRALGFARRDTAGLVAWELGPLAVVGIAVGVVVGLGLTWLVLGLVDLSVFTGGERPPLVLVDPVLTAATAAAFLLVAALATAVAVASITRTSLAGSLREGEDA